jgi:hypothetical protein
MLFILIYEKLIQFFESNLILNDDAALTLNDRLIFENIRAKLICDLVIEMKLVLIIEMKIALVIYYAAVSDCEVYRCITHFHFGLAILNKLYILFIS